MIKSIEVEFNPTPDELAKEIWEWDAEQQANFLYELAYLYNRCMSDERLQRLSEELNWEEGGYNKPSIVNMLETILEYVKGEGETK